MKNNKYIISSFFLAVLLVLSGCYYDLVVPSEISVIDTEVSFSNDIQPIFTQSCSTVGCHGENGIKPNLTDNKSFEALVSGNYIDTGNPASSELYQWMIGNRSISMPLSGPDAEINAYVLAWLDQGAKNN